MEIIWNPRGYFFWLLAVSLFCFLLERLVPWRKDQKALRAELGQDLFWLLFNGHFFGLGLAWVAAWAVRGIHQAFALWEWPAPESLRLLTDQPLWLQFLVLFVVKDFLEWCGHNLLHRVHWLWRFHKLHHTIEIMDWIGNFRFHWMEIVFYQSLKYFPLTILGIDWRVGLAIAVVSTLIGHLNHANLNISWGIIRYVLNSPRMHVWHHDVARHLPAGQNFGIVLSLWDWLFATAYMPAGQPARLGFKRLETFPRRLLPRLVYPLGRRMGEGSS